MLVVFLFALTSIGATVDPPASKPSTSASASTKKQTFKPGTPEAAVMVLLNIGFTRKVADPNEWFVLLHPYFDDKERMVCKQTVTVRTNRIVGGVEVPVPEDAPPGSRRAYLVTVEAEVLELRSRIKPEPIKRKGLCGWKDLEIVNRATGQVEKIGDVYMDESGVPTFSYERFGRKGGLSSSLSTTYVVDPNRRLWRFRVPLVYREIMRHEFVKEHGRYGDVLRRGWMFLSPYPVQHLSAHEELQGYIDIRKEKIQKLADCEGRGKPLSPETKASLCTPDWLEIYRNLPDAEIEYYRSLLGETSHKGAP